MIQYNKRRDINGRRNHRQSHFEYDWRTASKYNSNYSKFIAKEKVRIGEDSDEFQMSYCNKWILEKGMFVTDERLSQMYDPSMNLVKQWWRTPIVAGIDVARTNDSTVVTAVWVDWDHPDGFGFYEHRILNWLEINNTEWEQQYFEIIDFLRNYDVYRIGVDAQGVGGAVTERLQILMPNVEVTAVSSDAKAQNERWVHLTELIQRNQLVVPGHSKARRTRVWKKFNQQMSDLEKVYRGPYLLAAAPDEKGAFDDFPDSLAIACAMSVADTMPVITVTESPFFGR
jgi:phage FluMu gp28-like protein